MSYQKITSFAVKDTMADANPLKVVRGKEFDDEFDAITTAMNSQDLVIVNLVTTPTGGLLMFGGVTAPSGFLLCNGAAVSRNTYTALFQTIGTAYGVGDSTTTFNLPNLMNRFPYGAAVGQQGGFADAILPAHTHGAVVTDPGHAHTYSVATNTAPQSGSSTQCLVSNTAGTTGSATTGVTVVIDSAGTSPTNANLPPFLGVTFIIKT
jgi:microcystin-dependent protein